MHYRVENRSVYLYVRIIYIYMMNKFYIVHTYKKTIKVWEFVK